MLVLSRNVDESIVIGDDITITIFGVKGKQVRLGLSAPTDVRILREEVYEKVAFEYTSCMDNIDDTVNTKQ